jgi:hypothetical protein
MANWTIPSDVTSRWIGPNPPTDETLLEALIVDAETVILAEFPGIQARIDDETLNEDVVKLVTVRMVTRILRNPENATYLQQTTGPFGQARNFGDFVDIWMTPEERTMIAPAIRGKAFSVDLAPNSAAPTVDALTVTYDPLWRNM